MLYVCMYVTILCHTRIFSTKHENCKTFFNSSLHWHEGLLTRITVLRATTDPPQRRSNLSQRDHFSFHKSGKSQLVLPAVLERTPFLSVAPFASSKFCHRRAGQQREKRVRTSLPFWVMWFPSVSRGESWRRRCSLALGWPSGAKVTEGSRLQHRSLTSVFLLSQDRFTFCLSGAAQKSVIIIISFWKSVMYQMTEELYMSIYKCFHVCVNMLNV